jgi:hypothetical protein
LAGCIKELRDGWLSAKDWDYKMMAAGVYLLLANARMPECLNARMPGKI